MPDETQNQKPLHLIFAGRLADALSDASRDRSVLRVSASRLSGETAACEFRILSIDDLNNARGLRAVSFSIHASARRSDPFRVRDLRAEMDARRIPENDFLVGAEKPPEIPSHLVGDPRAVALAARARELAGDDPFVAYGLLICATAQALLLRDRDQWEGFTDLDLALSTLRERAKARADQPVTL